MLGYGNNISTTLPTCVDAVPYPFVARAYGIGGKANEYFKRQETIQMKKSTAWWIATFVLTLASVACCSMAYESGTAPSTALAFAVSALCAASCYMAGRHTDKENRSKYIP